MVVTKRMKISQRKYSGKRKTLDIKKFSEIFYDIEIVKDKMLETDQT